MIKSDSIYPLTFSWASLISGASMSSPPPLCHDWHEYDHLFVFSGCTHVCPAPSKNGCPYIIQRASAPQIIFTIPTGPPLKTGRRVPLIKSINQNYKANMKRLLLLLAVAHLIAFRLSHLVYTTRNVEAMKTDGIYRSTKSFTQRAVIHTTHVQSYIHIMKGSGNGNHTHTILTS